jgi:hypothetical protein
MSAMTGANEDNRRHGRERHACACCEELTPVNKLPDQKQRHEYFFDEVGEIAFIFLANLNRFNLDSRRYMANAIFNAVYLPLERREGELAGIDAESRRQLLDLATLDILAKVFMALEDLGKILLATGEAMKRVPAIILDAAQSHSLDAISRYSRKTDKELLAAFPFVHPREYGLAGAEEDAIKAYSLYHAGALKKILTFVGEFVDRHAWAYNKYKHGIPIILAMPSPPLPAGIDGPVPIFTSAADLKNAKFVLTGRAVVDKLIGFLGSVVSISKLLVERRLQIAELGGMPPPLLCHVTKQGTENTYQPFSWGHFDETTSKTFTAAFQTTMQVMKHTNIEATLNVESDASRIEDWVKFYTRPDWRII